jgi:two-component system chemotaxis response regulator CheY
MKSLIAEDNVVNQTILKKILGPLGSHTLAENGKDAVNAFREALDEGEPYDLVCLDIMMPVMDGQRALELMREEEERRGIAGLDCSKVLMMTALDDGRNVMKAFRNQCDGYITKPYKPSDFMAKLEELGLPRE